MNPRGRAWTYLANYQLRDFLLARAGLPAIVAVMFGVMIYKTAGEGVDWAAPDGQRLARQVFTTLVGVVITLGAFMGIAKLVTDDRTNGWFRFYFAKPVGRVEYYARQWVLHGVVLVALVGALGFIWQAATAAVPVREAMIVAALTWMLVGGVGFLFTVVSNQDAALLIVAYVASLVLHGIKDQRNSPMWPWLQQLTRFTMPTQKLDYVRDQLYAGNALSWSHTTHIVLYGLIALVVGIVVLRRASFAR